MVAACSVNWLVKNTKSLSVSGSWKRMRRKRLGAILATVMRVTRNGFGRQEPLPTKPHHRNTGYGTKPADGQHIGQTAEVSNTDSFGSSPVSSALDHSARRDPGKAITTLPHNQKPRKSEQSSTARTTPCKQTLQQDKTVTSQAKSVGRF